MGYKEQYKPTIEHVVDYSSNHEDREMPIFDLIDDLHKIVHEFYTKDVLSKAIIFAKLALSWRQKGRVLTQELLRVSLIYSAYHYCKRGI